jgi:tetratricopeptide (TPR) repeat protein
MGKKSRRKKARQTTTEDVAKIRQLEPTATPVHSVFTLWPSLHILLIILFSLIAYSNTFESSFHFDDEIFIVKNPIVKDLRYFAEPSYASDFRDHFEYKTFKRRYIGYFTFALNYKFHGLHVTGYHILNLLIHICTSLLLYFFIMLTFKTPSLRNSAIRDYARYIALFTALLFACHSLQTQAVTYIWQRVTSLCTMFYLLSLVAYIKWRLTREGTCLKTIPLYLISLISAILAMKTKEIAFMLPVMLVLYEMIFFEGNMKKRFLYLIPFLVTMLIIPLTLMSMDKPVEELIGDASETIRGNTPLSRGEYLLTEFRVLVTYLRLIFLPVHQNLYYDYPRYDSFFNIEVLSSFVFLALIFALSVYILFRYRKTVPHTRLIAFGIIWFFINLLLESSIIPLNNVIFEHRMYLPSVGIFSALSIVIFIAIKRWEAYKRVITVMLTVIIIVMTGVTYARNTVWKDEITLWQDVVNKSPNEAGGYNNLCIEYFSKKLFNKAVEQCQAAITHDPAYYKAYNNLGKAYESQGLIDKAIEQYQMSIKLAPYYAVAYNNLGIAYKSKGLIDKATEKYQMSIKLDPYYAVAYNNLGNVYVSQGLIDKAMEQYLTAIKINRYYPDVFYNLGNIYASQGLIDKAMEQYLLTVKFKPDYPDAHHNLGVAYKSKGLLDKAIEHYLLAIKFKPDYPKAHYNLGVAYKSQGNTELAIREFNKALRLRPEWVLPLKELEQLNRER